MAEPWIHQLISDSRRQAREQEAYDAAAFWLFTNLYSPAPIPAPRATIDGRIRGWSWEQIRRRIFGRDNYTCRYCGKEGGRLECDHVIPVSRGGGHADENLVTACFTCNRSKRCKLVSEWKVA